MPHQSSVPMSWRLQKNRYNLVGSFCESCNLDIFPPRKSCTKCGKDTKEKTFSGNGTIMSFTHITSAPTGFTSNYTIAIIKLDEGPTLTAQIVNPDKTDIEKKVKPVFRKMFSDGSSGVITYGTKFKVVE